MSPTKKRQTMGKMMRERELKERRVQKQEKKDERKAEAARSADLPDSSSPEPVDDDQPESD